MVRKSLPLYFSKHRSRRLDNPHQTAVDLCSSLRLPDEAKNMKASTLSVGQQQRVAVARALINSPSILLADEPSGNLDSKNAHALHQLLLKLNKETSQTIVVSTHNKELARLAQKTLKIKDGKII